MSISIKVEGLGKLYRLGEVGTGTLSLDLERMWAKLRGKPDPMLRIGQTNNREEAGGEYVWALKDIDFTMESGEVMGIIGRNGAGKSTLLKLLSRVTSPTKGRIRAKGRIAALLEVGTGFHPELTGRENVYLNGAILGMRRWEITKQLDAITEFSGCEKYLDTPVKRYSSGMLVRLGFAVAAHLECEILIVDEVLAVGDAEFQRRCIGKMQDVSKGGDRTVIFVSHNMASISALCSSATILEQGELIARGSAEKMVAQYLGRMRAEPPKDVGDHRARLVEFWAERENGERSEEFSIEESIRVVMVYEVLQADIETRVRPGVRFHTEQGDCAFASSMASSRIGSVAPGVYRASCQVPANLLNSSAYYLGFSLVFTAPERHLSFLLKDALCIQLIEPIDSKAIAVRRDGYSGAVPGAVRPVLDWTNDAL